MFSGTPFIAEWRADNNGDIIIPTRIGGYNFKVYWEEIGNSSNNGWTGTYTGSDTSYTISTSSADRLYKIEIWGEFPRIYFNNSGQKDSIKLITQWGDSIWTSFLNAFYGCSQLDIIATDTPVLTQVTTMNSMFRGCKNLKGIGANWNWNTNSVKNMSYLFVDNLLFNQNIGGWNVSSVTNMTYMFNNAISFNQDIGNWDVSSVANMSYMFYDASSFDQNLKKWNTGNVTTMSSMFRGASKFNQDISKWNISNVTQLNGMFRDAVLFNCDLSTWDTKNVTTMANMFNGASNFNQNLGNWDLLSVTSLGSMFSNSGMDCEHYGLTLKGWAENSNTPNAAITLGAANIKFGAFAKGYRDKLVDINGWTIPDNKDVLNCPCEWIGSDDNDWSNTDNWYMGGLPTSGDDFKFHSTVVRDLELDQNRTVGVINMINSGKKIILGNYNLTVTGLSNIGTGYVKTSGTGKLKMNVANGTTLLFPVGNSAYNPVEIKNNTGSGDVFSVRILDEVYYHPISPIIVVAPHIKRTWDIDKSTANGGSGVDFKFYWNSGEESALLTTPTLNHYNSGISAWEIATSGSGSASGTILTHTGYIGAFSPFAIGDGPIPLPVNLLNFQAIPNYETSTVQLTWQTAQEENNCHFEVLRSELGDSWETIGVIQGNGSTYSMNSYELVDFNPNKINYYRLRQVDYNGQSELSPIRFVEFKEVLNQRFQVYPNPTDGIITIVGIEGQSFLVTDIQGRKLLRGTLQNETQEIDLTELAQGIYFVKQGEFVAKIIKE
ncbi:MAG: BspA family leucine-rich repeat surface protein [Bacteroidetes bacterium]|nr:BspA family leucine-rich repeat surface protein [Bacteroidota bacterium]